MVPRPITIPDLQPFAPQWNKYRIVFLSDQGMQSQNPDSHLALWVMSSDEEEPSGDEADAGSMQGGEEEDHPQPSSSTPRRSKKQRRPRVTLAMPHRSHEVTQFLHQLDAQSRANGCKHHPTRPHPTGKFSTSINKKTADCLLGSQYDRSWTIDVPRLLQIVRVNQPDYQPPENRRGVLEQQEVSVLPRRMGRQRPTDPHFCLVLCMASGRTRSARTASPLSLARNL